MERYELLLLVFELNDAYSIKYYRKYLSFLLKPKKSKQNNTKCIAAIAKNESTSITI